MAHDLDEAAEALGGLGDHMSRLDQLATQFGRSLSRTLASGIAQGRSFDDILQRLGERLVELSLRAAFKPLETGLGSVFNGISGAVSGLFGGGGGGEGLFSGGTGGGEAGFGGLFGGGGVTVNMAVSTPDAESFRNSEGQIGAALARAVTRGQRNL
ncbi:phage tail tape measure protein [Rhabdaerophilum calidifontis]|uniref:phage tail tape measure protein n=1 Tax=Rhabdaerophilum calidifontis TaxID=2604328 RepID=UPI001FE54AB1|nr:phage tail tape measure protein [Rhabdaerophilum calidifontis]